MKYKNSTKVSFHCALTKVRNFQLLEPDDSFPLTFRLSLPRKQLQVSYCEFLCDRRILTFLYHLISIWPSFLPLVSKWLTDRRLTGMQEMTRTLKWIKISCILSVPPALSKKCIFNSIELNWIKHVLAEESKLFFLYLIKCSFIIKYKRGKIALWSVHSIFWQKALLR